MKPIKAVLIFERGIHYEENTEIEEFESNDEMLKFINEHAERIKIQAMYEVRRRLRVEPFEKTIQYRYKIGHGGYA